MGFACGGKVFQVGNCCIYFMCVVLGVDETRTFCGLSALVGCKGFCRVTSVFVFGFVLFVACCWVSRAARVLFYGSPLVGRIPDCWLVGVVCGVVCCVRTV